MPTETKKLIGTIDLTPSWPAYMEQLIVLIEAGNAAQVAAGKEELRKLARWAQQTLDSDKATNPKEG